MLLIILVLLLWGRGVELKTVYSKPSTNDTSTEAIAQVPPKRYADTDGSMSTNSDFYGIEFYSPPLIHRDLLAPTIFKQQSSRPAAYQLHGEIPHSSQSHQQLQQQPQLLHQLQQQPQLQLQPQQHKQLQHHQQLQQQPQQQHSTVADTNPILMNPLFYDEPVTSRYPSQPRPVARVIKYTEPGPGGGVQLPFFAAEDEPFLDSLPAFQYAVHRKPVATVPAPPQYALQRHTTPVQGPLYHHRLHRPVHRRYPPHYAYGGDVRYTHVPVVYNVQAPPPLDSGEYDLVTRFNKLLKQRERDSQREEVEGEEEETTRPAKRKKKVKKRKKKKSTPPPPPPLVEDEIEAETENPFDDDRQEQQQEEPSPEEQESQNIQTNEQLPEGTIIQDDDELQKVEQTDPMTEHFSEDLNFQDGTGERVEFQMHGMGGPESYKFGFDTGKGMNRQFRYEERDSNGHVRGHYGYRDNDGKLQIYNYTSHPEFGYNAQKVETLEA